jgi:hypothetical protein
MEERLKDTGAPGYPKPANEYPPRKTRQEILNELPGNVASTAGRVSGAVRNAFKPKPPVEPEPVDPWLSRTQPTGDNPTRHRSFKDSINAHHGFQRARRKAREQQLKEQAAQEPNSEGQS